MKGDFSRDTFDPAKHFSRVLMQQGRVQLDADWNEQASILLHYLRTLAKDIFGPHAGPAAEMGFELITKHGIGTLSAQKQDAKWKEIERDNEERRSLLRKGVEKQANVVISRGRYYVDGIMVENHNPILYSEQLGYPFTPETSLESLQDRDLIYYLDVWERHVTHVQDDDIREVALGGADTCTRAQVAWQVKALLGMDAETLDCKSFDDRMARRNLPELRARAQKDSPSADACSMSPESKYRGLENHLYRVEVHEVDVSAEPDGRDDGNSEGTIATFKWSRDNGSVVFPIVSLNGTTAIVSSLGRDQCSQLKPHDWVEVCDDALALRGQSGPLAQVVRVDRDELTVTLKWPEGVVGLPSYQEEESAGMHPLLRRWDQHGDLTSYRGALAVTESADPKEGWIALEDGIEIWFAAGKEYRVGDYWLIPARVATGDVQWPHDVEQLLPAAQPPHGPRHFYAPLLQVKADTHEINDCRCSIPHLSCE